MKSDNPCNAVDLFLAAVAIGVCGTFLSGCLTVGVINDRGDTDNGNQNASSNGFSVVPETLSGTVEVENFTIPAGTQVTVTGDLELIATGDVVIDGSLVAEANPDGDGYNISITADGDITVEGSIQAGAPAEADAAAAHRARAAQTTYGKTLQESETDLPGKTGGTLNLKSEHGNLAFGRNSTLIAFDGTDATGGVTGAPGGRGGSVSLCAAYGKLSMRASIFLGNGGHGGNADLDTETLEGTFPRGAVLNDYDFENSGGDSGHLSAFAADWDWPALEFYGDFVEEIGRSPMLDPAAYAAEPSTGVIIGGVAGNAGSVLVLDDLTKVLERIEQERTGGTVDTFSVEFKIRAAPGGQGWLAGGHGGLLIVHGLRWNGRDGVEFKGIGGAGGDIVGKRDPNDVCGMFVRVIGGIAGMGGSATVTSPGGIPPVTARGSGNAGNGGKAIAWGGRGGHASTEVHQTGGVGGFAASVAGPGGGGLSSCFANDVGSGGNGGGAFATGGSGGDGWNRGEGGLAETIAGVGGDGGDGEAAVGSAGKGGDSAAWIGSQGSNGQVGEVIEAGAQFEEKAVDGIPGEVDYLKAPDYCADVDYLCPDGILCGS